VGGRRTLSKVTDEWVGGDNNRHSKQIEKAIIAGLIPDPRSQRPRTAAPTTCVNPPPPLPSHSAFPPLHPEVANTPGWVLRARLCLGYHQLPQRSSTLTRSSTAAALLLPSSPAAYTVPGSHTHPALSRRSVSVGAELDTVLPAALRRAARRVVGFGSTARLVVHPPDAATLPPTPPLRASQSSERLYSSRPRDNAAPPEPPGSERERDVRCVPRPVHPWPHWSSNRSQATPVCGGCRSGRVSRAPSARVPRARPDGYLQLEATASVRSLPRPGAAAMPPARAPRAKPSAPTPSAATGSPKPSGLPRPRHTSWSARGQGAAALATPLECGGDDAFTRGGVKFKPSGLPRPRHTSWSARGQGAAALATPLECGGDDAFTRGGVKFKPSGLPRPRHTSWSARGQGAAALATPLECGGDDAFTRGGVKFKPWGSGGGEAERSAGVIK
jgi:hypothetical protein